MKNCHLKSSIKYCAIKVCVSCGILLIGWKLTSIKDGHLRFACQKCIDSGKARWTPLS